MQSYKARKIQQLKKGGVGQLCALAGVRKIPCVLGKFSDSKRDPWEAIDLKKELFDGPWPTGTMKAYFRDMSYGQFNISGDVEGWITVSHPMQYYSTHLTSFDNPHTKEFFKEALDSADARIDFRQYDNDGPDGIPNSGDDDGYVDVVFFLSDNDPQRQADDICPHFYRYSLWFGTPYSTKDTGANNQPIKVDEYTSQRALTLDGKMAMIGTFCHELGHALGLPDLYDIDMSSIGIGEWGLMGYFNSDDQPVGMEAWSKAHLGWLIPKVLAEDEYKDLRIENSYQNPAAYIVRKKGIVKDEYFLLENHRKIGFDAPRNSNRGGVGLLIWHVDDSKFRFEEGGFGFDNSGNADERHRGLDLEEADNKEDFITEQGDPFPGSTGNHTFDRNSAPNSRDCGGFDTGISIFNIRDTGADILLDVKVNERYLQSFITSPSIRDFINSKQPIEVKGTADGTYLSGYSLSVGEGEAPVDWHLFFESNAGVKDSTLGTLDASFVKKEDRYTIRLTVRDDEGNSTASTTCLISPEYPLGWPRTVEDRIVAQSVGADDLDRDGTVEIVAGVANGSKSAVKLYVWKADGSLKDPRIWPKELNGNQITAPAFADLDHDGRKEILVNTGNLLYALRIDGTNVRGWPKYVNSYSPPVVSDIDGDGKVEIISSGSLSNQVYVWRAEGTAFTGWPQSVEGLAYFSPVVADLDNDGKCEIIQKTDYERIYVWNCRGQLLDGWPSRFKASDALWESGPPVVGDLDGDGQKWIISSIDYGVYVFDVHGVLRTCWPRQDGVRSVVLADIDLDGKPEIIGIAPQNIRIYNRVGGTLLGWPQTPPSGSSFQLLSPIAAEVNGDGKLELFVVQQKDEEYTSRILAYTGDGLPLKGWPREVPALFDVGTYYRFYQRCTPLIADIDQDGAAEVVLGMEDKVLVWELGGKPEHASSGWSKWQSNNWNTGEYRFIPADDTAKTGWPRIAVTKTLAFGRVNLGEWKDTVITVANEGIDTLKLMSITSSAACFSARPTAGFVLPGQALSDTIRFTPDIVGAVSGTLLVYSNALTSPDTITVLGYGDLSDKIGINDLTSRVPKEYLLTQNYPNPFNSETVIKYGLPVRSHVKIQVFSCLGQLISTLIEGEQEARYYHVRWLGAAASGMYFYRIVAIAVADPSKCFMQTRKMILLK